MTTASAGRFTGPSIHSHPCRLYALRAVPSIHIIVKNGHVTLVGVAATKMDKDAAGIRANGVSGVFSVDNQLTVEGGGK